MAARTKGELLDALAQYGYPLLRPSVPGKPEVLLKQLVEQDDVRLMEGFPVVLANAMETKEQLEWESGDWNPPRGYFSKEAGEKLVCLLALSYLLFKLFGLEAGLQKRAQFLLKRFDSSQKTLGRVEENFMESRPVKANGVVFATDRLKNTFRNYALHPLDERKVEEKKHELELELLLSELFTLTQKNLIKKKLAGSRLSKTEREYFSRVVKKRLKALANVELHQLAVQLLNK